MFRNVLYLSVIVFLGAVLCLAGCEWIKLPASPKCQKTNAELIRDDKSAEDRDCVQTDKGLIEYKGPFRHRWWHYYNRALFFAENGCWEEAENDLTEAIRQRYKDQWDARTYGMHFIDYFPHRELGIAYYYHAQEDYDQAENETKKNQAILKMKHALDELMISLEGDKSKKTDGQPSAKALFYIEPVYKNLVEYKNELLENGIGQEKLTKLGLNSIKISKPIIEMDAVQKGTDAQDKILLSKTRNNIVTISGYVKDENYIKSISVNGEPVFLLNSLEDRELYEQFNRKVPFKKQLYLPQGQHTVKVEAKNIMGESAVPEMIRAKVDNYGPSLAVEEIRYAQSSDEKIIINGLLEDESGISDLFINGKNIPIQHDGNRAFFSATIASSDRRLELIAYDRLGNRMISTQMPSATQSSPPLLASAGVMADNRLVGQPAKKSPSIEIKVLREDCKLCDTGDYLDFCKEEFKVDGKSEQILVDEIKKDMKDIHFEHIDNIQFLNKLLIDAQLYKQIDKNGKFSKYYKKLSNLSDNEQKIIKKLNRLILEEIYSEYVPKSRGLYINLTECQEIKSRLNKIDVKIVVDKAQNFIKEICFDEVCFNKRWDTDVDFKKNYQAVEFPYYIDLPKGGKVSKIVKVKEKNNTITSKEVISGIFDDKAEIEFNGESVTVKQEECEPYNENMRYSVFILPLNLKRNDSNFKTKLKEKLSCFRMFGTEEKCRFNISRENIDEVLYHKITTSDEKNGKEVQEFKNICRDKGIRCFVRGSFKKERKKGHLFTEVIINVVDTAKTDLSIEKMPSIDTYIRGNDLDRLAQDIANKFSVEFPLLVGNVVGVEKDNVIITDLQHPKLRKNYRVITFFDSEETTGKEFALARIIEPKNNKAILIEPKKAERIWSQTITE
ncbi:hypothetical protein [Desulfonema magnum]|uniref:Tetratricopeptide domain-containing protein n=1 Tax=Desulfonema magnum TaxID=45655 RepID=A0A975BW26_9BACT|nr:hypothetical protein [Desulfonema magnum]QTA92274.1 tetratricopeptide domain-containing protein [Desulfonema magnum]